MVESNVLKFGDFTLKSGRKSPFFMNAGAYVTGSQLKRLAAKAFQHALPRCVRHSGIIIDALGCPKQSRVVCGCDHRAERPRIRAVMAQDQPAGPFPTIAMSVISTSCGVERTYTTLDKVYQNRYQNTRLFK